MIPWNEVEAHPLYKEAEPEKRRDARLKYFQKNILESESYKLLEDDKKTAIRTEFLAHPDTVTANDSGWTDVNNWYEAGKKALGTLALIQHPATTAYLSKEFIKGVTLGGVDLEAPNADGFLEKASKAGFMDTRKAAGVVS